VCQAATTSVGGDAAACRTFEEPDPTAVPVSPQRDALTCRTADCRFNSLFDCLAAEISMTARHDRHFCDTFRLRSPAAIRHRTGAEAPAGTTGSGSAPGRPHRAKRRKQAT